VATPPTKPPPLEESTEVLVRDGERLKLRTRTVRIEVLAGPNAGQVVEAYGPEVRVGTGRGVQLILFDPTVSRHHFTLKVERAGIRVLDAGSSNGTVLDGVRVRDAYARPDSVIVIGSTTLRLRLSQGLVDLPLSARERFGGLLGKSVAMRQVFTLLERIAPTDDSVLIEGETGTGKELVAEAIHEESPRAASPFVVFDCSSVAPNLIESELFGHVRGAFTGAVSDRAGVFEQADGGTLFLDEIGELPLDLQPKLLRALERLEVRRIGANTVRRVDVRVVAATNRSLANESAERRFREDLYYRLAVIHVELPPLRARLDDVPLLVEHFEAQLLAGGRRSPLSKEAKDALRGSSWPGNVRELRNAVARALSLGSAQLAPPSPTNAVDLSVPFPAAREALNERFERDYLSEALRAAGGNATLAAEMAGVNRKFMQRAIKRLDLRGRS
jgi:transcriptional regulator with GAF, ATPase, and Fis domain